MSLRYVILRRFCDSVLCNCTCSLRRPHPCLLSEHPTPHPWRKNQSPPSKTLPLGIGCSPHLWTKGGRKYFLIHVIISILIIMTHSHRVIRIFLWQIYIKKCILYEEWNLFGRNVNENTEFFVFITGERTGDESL